MIKKIVAMGVLVAMYIGIAITINRFEYTQLHSDLFSRWYATRMLLTEGRSLYDNVNTLEVSEIVGDLLIREQASFFYPAHLLIITAPLSLFPFPIANFIWLICIQFFYVFGLWIFAQDLGWPRNSNGIAILLVLASIFIPHFQHTIYGQFNTIGLFSLALTYYSLRRQHYFLSGLWLVGLTIKPQGTLVTLAFFLLWALLNRRWNMLAGFGTIWGGIWLIAEILMPGWVIQFLTHIQGYSSIGYKLSSVLDQIWNPYQIVTITLLVGSLVLFWKNRHSQPTDAGFIGCVGLGVMVSSLTIPIIGMLHSVLWPAAVILIMGTLAKYHLLWARYVLNGILFLYFVGYVLYVYGLLTVYGMHIAYGELIYKTVAPLLMMPIFVWLAIYHEPIEMNTS
ncbi:MAG: DUF2029 domain-containing protein [Anaerolineae bacterium]|nr:DUF2029 domain-containing protein [Anaerolineae bacterium]